MNAHNCAINSSSTKSSLDQDLQLQTSITYLGDNVAIKLFLNDDYSKTSAMQTQKNAQSQTLVDCGIYDILEAVMHQTNLTTTFLLIVQCVLHNAGHHECSPLHEHACLDQGYSQCYCTGDTPVGGVVHNIHALLSSNSLHIYAHLFRAPLPCPSLSPSLGVFPLFPMVHLTLRCLLYFPHHFSQFFSTHKLFAL